MINRNKIYLPIFSSLALLLSTACEPQPKMVSYGSNEYGQLEFEGTSWDHEPLHEGYLNAWAGKDFTVVYKQGYYGDDLSVYNREFLCKGNNDLGQCDLPGELNSFVAQSGFNSNTMRLDLGFNHGFASIDTVYYPTLGNFFVHGSWRMAWGDNSYGQLEFPDALDTSVTFQMVAGGNHNIALVGDTAWIWQYNDFGNTILDSIIISNLKIVAWGDNQYGQCDVPAQFQNVSSDFDFNTIKIYAGGNHSIIVYDSLGTTKMFAWGDNQYGQCNVPSTDMINGPNYLLDLVIGNGDGSFENRYLDNVFCGDNHSVALLYNPNQNLLDDINAQPQSLYVINSISSYYDYYYYYDTYYAARPVSLIAWGDNTYGQCDIPDINGLVEDFDVGGNHNSIALQMDNGWAPDVPTLPYRDVIGWGKNDYNQTDFPLRYYVSSSFGPPMGAPGNSSPTIKSGGDHNIVKGPQIFRAPNMDYNLPNPFTGSLGDTIFQTITVSNIGPDTLYIDSIFITGQDGTTLSAQPFYHNFSVSEIVEFGEDISFDIYCIYDSAHSNSEYANMTIYNRGWWDDTTSVPLNSLFQPQISYDFSSVEPFRGGFGETVFHPVYFRNEGTDTVYIDSITITEYNSGTWPNGFSYESLGDENIILPGDSISIYLSASFDFLTQTQFNATYRFYFRTFNTISIGLNTAAFRYLAIGEELSFSSYYVNSFIYYCNNSLSNPNDNGSYFYLFNLDQESTLSNVHYFDFGVLDTNSNQHYISEIDSLTDYFSDNQFFASLIGSPYYDNCNYQDSIEAASLFENQEDLIIFRDNWFENLFPDHVESVVINHQGIITYMDTFNLENVKGEIENQLNECGVNCVSGTALSMSPELLELTLHEGESIIDTLFVENSVPHNLSYSLNSTSGTELSTSVYFSLPNFLSSDRIIFPVDSTNSPITFSFWFKPQIDNWSVGADRPYTTFIAPVEDNITDPWEIILDDNPTTPNGVSFPRIGWKDETVYTLSETPVLSNQWYHAVFCHDQINQSLSLYLNGSLEFTNEINSDLSTGISLGINFSDYGYYTGRLTQVSIWDNTLSESEILSIYESGLINDLMEIESDFSSADLLGYWRMNENSGDIAFDYSGNGLNADLYGTDWDVELVNSGVNWLNILIGEIQNIEASETNLNIFHINTIDLNPGFHVGVISMEPTYGNYTNEITSTIRLEVLESLNTESDISPGTFLLHQNYPNPFNPVTEIKYEIPKRSDVSIKIFDILGNEVFSRNFEGINQGYHSIKWNAKNINGGPVSAGLYFYTLDVKNTFRKTKKMILLK